MNKCEHDRDDVIEITRNSDGKIIVDIHWRGLNAFTRTLTEDEIKLEYLIWNFTSDIVNMELERVYPEKEKSLIKKILRVLTPTK